MATVQTFYTYEYTFGPHPDPHKFSCKKSKPRVDQTLGKSLLHHLLLVVGVHDTEHLNRSTVENRPVPVMIVH